MDGPENEDKLSKSDLEITKGNPNTQNIGAVPNEKKAFSEDRQIIEEDSEKSPLDKVETKSKQNISVTKVQEKNEIQNEEVKSTIPERIQKLLDLVRVKKVYYIDDANCKNIDVEVFLGKIKFLFQQEDVEEKIKLIEFDNFNSSEPYDVMSETIKENWKIYSKDQKQELMKKLNQVYGDTEALLDYEVTPKLKEYFPKDLIVYVDPLEWEEVLGKLKNELEETDKVLLLFDQNLKDAGGIFNLRNGVDLIIQIKQTALKDRAICALLTHNIAATDFELYYRQQIKDQYEHDIEFADFFPLSKQRLYEPEVFADGIKKTFINNHFEVIKDETIKVIKDSQEKALEKIKKLDTYDFDDAIIKTSAKEGVWEIDTLLRISEIIQKDELYQSLVDSNYSIKVNPEIKAALLFKEIDFKIPPNYKPYSEKAKLRHKELYQSGELINKLHKPIENGDIFQYKEDQYILVAQPCDLMVRGKGNKAGKRNAKYVTLLKMDKISREDYNKKKKSNSMQDYLINKHAMFYLNDQTTDMHVVLFNESITVDVDVLDLIVYNDAGHCRFTLPNNNFNSDLYNTSWEFRFDYIKDKLVKFKEKISLSLLKVKEDIENRSAYIEENFYPRLVTNSTSDEIFKIDSNENSFDFKFKRILNFKSFNAAYLLDRYLRYLSRTAELHDFAQ